MTAESPTLKVRIAHAGAWGKDCNQAARELLGPDVEILDAKWGREPSKWRETGRGWGRVKLATRDAGYVQAVRDLLGEDGGVEAELLRIIDGLTK